jgi:uncharacterized membrane protein
MGTSCRQVTAPKRPKLKGTFVPRPDGQTSRVTRIRLWHYLKSSLWFVPLLCVFGGVALSFGTIALDRLLGSVIPRSLSGDPDAALAILTTVAASMVTLTGLVLTITMVVVQLAMGQFTPRVLRTVLRDRPSQLAIGSFVATFAHAMLVMREVRAPGPGDPDGYVPGLAIVVAYVLVVISVMVLVSYVHHIGQALRAASLIESVGEETRALVDEVYPLAGAKTVESAGPEPQAGGSRLIAAPESGVLRRVGAEQLVGVAREADVMFSVIPRIGDFVPAGSPVIALHGTGDVDDGEVLGALLFGKERTLERDVAYGFRMLVDVALRSLSSAMGDPTTAVQAIDRIHDCLRQLAARPFPSGRHLDADGRLRLVVPILTWDGYVELACGEIVHAAGASIQVTRRLQAMLDDLLTVAPPARHGPLERQTQILAAVAAAAYDALGEREVALGPDQQGIGSGADLVADRASTPDGNQLRPATAAPLPRTNW